MSIRKPEPFTTADLRAGLANAAAVARQWSINERAEQLCRPCKTTVKSAPTAVPMPQPPDYTLPGMEPPAPSRSRDKRNTCSICLEPLSGHPEANAELPDTLERLTACQHQFHRYCCATHVRGGGPNSRKLFCPLCRVAVPADEAQAMISWLDGFEPPVNAPPLEFEPSEADEDPAFEVAVGALQILSRLIASPTRPDLTWTPGDYGYPDDATLFSLNGYFTFMNVTMRDIINAFTATDVDRYAIASVEEVMEYFKEAAPTWRNNDGDLLIHVATRANKPEYLLALTHPNPDDDGPPEHGGLAPPETWTELSGKGETIALLSAFAAINAGTFELRTEPPDDSDGMVDNMIDLWDEMFTTYEDYAPDDDTRFAFGQFDQVPTNRSPLYPMSARAYVNGYGANLPERVRAVMQEEE